jgi:hypothetical protein
MSGAVLVPLPDRDFDARLDQREFWLSSDQ